MSGSRLFSLKNLNDGEDKREEGNQAENKNYSYLNIFKGVDQRDGHRILLERSDRTKRVFLLRESSVDGVLTVDYFSARRQACNSVRFAYVVNEGSWLEINRDNYAEYSAKIDKIDLQSKDFGNILDELFEVIKGGICKVSIENMVRPALGEQADCSPYDCEQAAGSIPYNPPSFTY